VLTGDAREVKEDSYSALKTPLPPAPSSWQRRGRSPCTCEKIKNNFGFCLLLAFEYIIFDSAVMGTSLGNDEL
jgi:hypothetical protein